MMSIQEARKGIEAVEQENLKVKDVCKLLGTSIAWVYKKNLGLEATCVATTGKKKKKYYVIRKKFLLNWLADSANQDELVKVWCMAREMKRVREQSK